MSAIRPRNPVPLVIAILLLTIATNAFAVEAVQRPNGVPIESPSPETVEILRIQAETVALLRDLGDQFAATLDPAAARIIAAKISRAKADLELKTLETRIRYARDEGRSERLAQLMKMLAARQESAPKETPEPKPAGEPDTSGRD